MVWIEALPRCVRSPDCVPAEADVLNGSCAQPSAALPLRLRDAAEQRNAQQDRKRRRERELLFRTDNEVRRKLVEQVEAQQRRREQRRCAAK